MILKVCHLVWIFIDPEPHIWALILPRDTSGGHCGARKMDSKSFLIMVGKWDGLWHWVYLTSLLLFLSWIVPKSKIFSKKDDDLNLFQFFWGPPHCKIIFMLNMWKIRTFSRWNGVPYFQTKLCRFFGPVGGKESQIQEMGRDCSRSLHIQA